MAIEFHILQATKLATLTYTCKLIENFYAQHQPVYIQTNSANAAAHLDKLLWTFRDDSFIPHSLVPENNGCGVRIGSVAAINLTQTILINLSQTIVADYETYALLIEVVAIEDQIKARERYKYYRDAAHTIRTLKLPADEI